MSFRRARPPAPAGSEGSEQVILPGVRTSPAGVRVTSSGIGDVDAALGGGLPVGSLTVLIEDAPTAHHDALVRLFLAQGLVHGHAVALACSTAPPADVFAALPIPRDVQKGALSRVNRNPQALPEDGLRIAWRYAKAKTAATVASTGVTRETSSYLHAFDLSESCPTADDAPVSHLGFGRSTSLRDVGEDIAAHVRSANRKKLLGRVVVSGLSSDLWDCSSCSLVRFLHHLRVGVQRNGAVALVTIPYSSFSTALAREADIVFRLDSFDGKGAGVAGLGDEWLGILSVEKCFRPPGSLKSVIGDAKTWVFKRGRRKYVFEAAAGAPDDERRDDDDKSSARGHQANAGEGLCAPGPQSSKYDF